MKINLFDQTGKNWKDSISVSELINVIPDVSQDKAGGGITFENFFGMTNIVSIATDTDDQFLDLYSVNTPLLGFEDRTYVLVYDDSLTAYYIYRLVYGDALPATVSSIGVLTGASGNFSNFSHDKSKHGGKVIIGDKDSNKLWVVTMDNDPASDAVAAYTMPTGWALQTIDYQDGFFVGNIKDTGANDEQRKFVSSDFGATTFTSSMFGLMSSSSGNIIASDSDKREVWLFCDDHIEPWYNQGGDGFVFIRNPSVYIDVGLYSRDSLAKHKNIYYFVGFTSDGGVGVYQISGYTPTEITPPLLMNSLGDGDFDREITWSFGRILRIGNHAFYLLNTASSTLGTWCFCIKNGLWFRIEDIYYYGDCYSRGESTQEGGGPPYGKNLVIPHKTLDQFTGELVNHPVIHAYKYSTYTRFSVSGLGVVTTVDMDRTMVSNHIYGPDNKILIHKKLTLEFVPSSASVVVLFSDDDGATYTTFDTFSITSGLIEVYQLGASKDRIYKLTCATDADFSLINAWIDVTVGLH